MFYGRKHRKKFPTHWVVLKLVVWSLRILKVTGESPMQYFLSSVVQMWRLRRDGLLS